MHAHTCCPRCLMPSLLSAYACATGITAAAGILFNRNTCSVCVSMSMELGLLQHINSKMAEKFTFYGLNRL